MPLELALESASEIASPIPASTIEQVAHAALRVADALTDDVTVELSIRLVDRAESAALNGAYRDRPHATNVLSFPAGAELPGLTVLGDLVICMPVLVSEAADQRKSRAAHMSHMVIHGVLHLLGFDHMRDDEAVLMEDRECRAMAALGYDDPYRDRQSV